MLDLPTPHSISASEVKENVLQQTRKMNQSDVKKDKVKSGSKKVAAVDALPSTHLEEFEFSPNKSEKTSTKQTTKRKPQVKGLFFIDCVSVFECMSYIFCRSRIHVLNFLNGLSLARFLLLTNIFFGR